MLYGEATEVPETSIARGGRTSAMDQFRAGWEAQTRLDNTNSLSLMMDRVYGEHLQTVRQNTGVDLAQEYRRIGESLVGSPPDSPGSIYSAVGFTDYDRYDFEVWAAAEQSAGSYYEFIHRRTSELRAERPDVADLIPSREQFDENLRARAQSIEAREQDLFTRGTFRTGAAGFAGRIAGAFTDPVNVGTLPFGSGGKTFLGTAVRVGGTNAAIEAASQPFVQHGRSELGLEAGFEQGVKNVAFAGAGGAALGVSFKGLSHVPQVVDKVQLKVAPGRWAAREMHRMLDDAADQPLPSFMTREDMLDRFNRVITDPDSDQSYVRHIVEQDTALDRSSEVAGAVGQTQHRAAVNQVQKGQPVEVPDAPVVSDPRPDPGMESFRPADLNVDAKRFQFKSGGDADGVTDTLRDVTKWDPVMSGNLVVWRDLGGRNWVADGHQRHGLASRLEGEDPNLEISLPGHVLREADGVTAEYARAVAAAKNINQGTGTAIDAAKIFRNAPSLLDGRMSRSAAVSRQGMDMMRLTDDAFLMAVNDVVPSNYAAFSRPSRRRQA